MQQQLIADRHADKIWAVKMTQYDTIQQTDSIPSCDFKI